jgi:1-acyl-sn-glycerol-3-phosphate acyltransferase
VHVLGARDYFFDRPLKAWLFRHLLNVVPFDREKNFVEGLRTCRAVLRPGQPVLIFPEGTRSQSGRLQPFKVGLGILALELGTPVVPARIRGTFESFPKGARLPRPERVEIAFGEPVEVAPFLARRGQAATYDLYREYVSEVRQRVERLLDEA